MTQDAMREAYYVQNKERGYLGNAPIWWAKDGKGYTAYVLNAHRFTQEDAEDMVRRNPDKWAMYPANEVDKRLHLVFDSQDFSRLGTDEPCGWAGGYAAHQSREAEVQRLTDGLARAIDAHFPQITVEQFLATPREDLPKLHGDALRAEVQRLEAENTRLKRIISDSGQSNEY